MLKITVELWPYGRERDKRTIGEMTIINDATGTANVGHYYGTLSNDKGEVMHARVNNFGRAGGFWKLIHQMIQEARHAEHKEEYT